MIAEPEKNNQQGEPQDKLTGALKKTALAAAIAELLIYWLLVIRFPAAMAPLSVLLGFAAWYFRRTMQGNKSLREDLRFSERDLEIVKKYCTTWIYIAAYGTAFAVFLILKGWET